MNSRVHFYLDITSTWNLLQKLLMPMLRVEKIERLAPVKLVP